jgi:dipeptidyl aminopeptidase/acylaminoacyl peptidase
MSVRAIVLSLLFGPGLLLAAATTAEEGAPKGSEKPPFSATDVFKLNWASDPRVSGDGSFIVYKRNFMDIMEDRRRSNLWRIDSDGGNHQPITTGAVNDSGAAISPDGTRVAYLSSDDKGTQVFVQWLAGGQRAQLTRLNNAPRALEWSPDGRWLAFAMLVPAKPATMGELPPAPKGAEWAKPAIVVKRSVFRLDGQGYLPEGHTHLFVVPAIGGNPRQVTSGDYRHSGDYDWSADSGSLVFSANRYADWEMAGQESELFRVAISGGEIEQLTERVGPDGSPRVSPDGKQIAFLGFDDKESSYTLNKIYLMNNDGSKSRLLLKDFERSVGNLYWDHSGRGLFFSYNQQGKTHLAYTNLSGKWQDISDNLSGLSLGRPYTGSAFAVGGKGVYAYTGGDPWHPADIVSGRRGAKVQRQLTQLSENLVDYREMARVEELWLKSSFDQRDIQAWVAYPPGFDPAVKYPLLLEIHGGPHTAYGPHFSVEVQMFAAAGYVVLYVNPRGSTSYGEEFARLIDHNYPSQDYDDLMSAVDVVIDRGSIDEDQLYVTGGSGGGVLTAWIVGSTERFRAAVVAKPVINWLSFVLHSDNIPFFARYWFGDMPWEAPMEYWRRSPLSLVGNVTTPTMLLTGESDYRTPISESEQYYQALKLQGIDTALVRIPGASHTIAARPSQLLAKVAAILAWFEQHNGAAEPEE